MTKPKHKMIPHKSNKDYNETHYNLPFENKKNVEKLTKDKDFTKTPSSFSLKRRGFLGIGLFGLTGIALPSLTLIASTASKKLKKSAIGKLLSGKEKTYWDRTDKFEVKKELLKSAWQRKDYRAVRALTNSIRISGIQAQLSEELPDDPISGSSDFNEVSSLPASWKAWAKGWKYFKVLNLEEKSGFIRDNEPIEVLLGFQAQQVHSLQREIRVARISDGVLMEVTSQIYGELRRGNEWFGKLLFLSGRAKSMGKQSFLVFYGNPDAELPDYTSDLVTTGEEYRLDIENEFYKIHLSHQAGQIERLTFKRNSGMELYAGGDGHGEPGALDWSHDYYADGGYQKFRTALWDECPDYEVVRGPICTIVRRWGFPYSPLHPLFSPSRLNIDVEYRFYAGVPYFHKFSNMSAVKDFKARTIRDDEWVFPGQTLPEVLWMGPEGKLNIGDVDPEYKNNLWGVGFFNRETKDSLIALYLEHSINNNVKINHSGVPRAAYYRFHGQVWSRHAVLNQFVPKGTILHQKNAYITLPFNEEEGPAKIEKLRKKLLNPIEAFAGEIEDLPKSKKSLNILARKGEKDDSIISKQMLWKALEKCKDPQLYKSDISIVELGLVYDIAVKGDSVNVIMTMPHKGRPLASYFMYGSNTVHDKLSLNISTALMEVPGVVKVTMEQTSYPEWTSNLITDEGRRKLEILK